MLLATGTPEEVAKVENSYTGQYLKKWIERDKKAEEAAKCTKIDMLK